MSQFILTMDIGGTTFTSCIFNEDLKEVISSDIGMIADFSDKESLLEGFAHQGEQLMEKSNIDISQIKGMGVSVPGPLDAGKGLILDTPNLALLQQTNLKKELESRLNIPVFIENDANLFVWGEWNTNHRNASVMVGLTLGSGLGVGVVINGKIFSGAHGMGAEYGISPMEDGVWEDKISIEGVENLAVHHLGKKYSPLELYNLAESNNQDALIIWQKFGENLGMVISHLINLLDPAVMSLGGGIAKAFPFLIQSAENILKKYSPSFSYNSIPILQCNEYLCSIHRGAALLVQDKIT